ncbi:MAG TPA: prenyltransferase [Armatimonadota bacterium]|nr:prenyltransferase [Armatimonadota bacterium]
MLAYRLIPLYPITHCYGLGFGPLMVVGTQIALTGHATPLGWVASLVPFFLVNNLLLLNQFPDAEADSSVGRKHVLVLLGPQRCSIIYLIFLAAAYLSILVGVLLRYLPPLALIGLGTIPIAIATVRGVLRYRLDIPRLTPYLGMNVVINLASPVLLAVGLTLGR